MHKAIRYIGSKQKVLPFLEGNLLNQLKEGDTFFDGFVGSGIVSQYVAEKHKNITLNGGDLSLYSGVLFNILNIGQCFSKKNEILSLINEFEQKELISGFIYNEFSNTGNSISYMESRNFFHELSGKTLDSFKYFIKMKLEKNQITQEQSQILYYFLISYACKIANTTSVFGAFLKSPAKYQPLNVKFVEKILLNLEDIFNLKNKASFYHGDIVKNLKEIPKQTMIYLDPPYTTRRYESNYHILNYIADKDFDSNKIKKHSKTGQPQEMQSNPFGKKKETQVIFSQMIIEGCKKSGILAISYNTDGLIKQEWMENFCLENKLLLKTKKLDYKRFKSKSDVKNETDLEEILWLIKK